MTPTQQVCLFIGLLAWTGAMLSLGFIVGYEKGHTDEALRRDKLTGQNQPSFGRDSD